MKKKQLFGLALTAALAVTCLAAPALAAEDDASADAAQPASLLTVEAAAEPETTAAEPETTAQAETPAATEQPTVDTEATAQPEATPAPAQRSYLYVALGDSITAGNGLPDFQYNPAEVGVDASPNFLGYSSNCFVAKVAENLGLDRAHAVNLGLPELMSGDMLELLQNGAMSQINQPAWTYYSYPEYQEYVRQADVITLQIGSNDALIPFVVSIWNATNKKSEQFANSLVTGLFRDFWSAESQALLSESLSKLTLTSDEKSALRYALGDGMQQVCNAGYANVTTNLPQIIEAIRALNPDVDIILLGYYNPAWMLPAWSDYFNKLNTFEKQLAADYGLTYVDVGWTCTANDLHPTVNGHKYIARKVTSAIKRQPSYKAYTAANV